MLEGLSWVALVCQHKVQENRTTEPFTIYLGFAGNRQEVGYGNKKQCRFNVLEVDKNIPSLKNMYKKMSKIPKMVYMYKQARMTKEDSKKLFFYNLLDCEIIIETLLHITSTSK